MFRQPTVSDFLLDKDPLFARLNLSDDEYTLYEKVYRHLKPQTPRPTLSSICKHRSIRCWHACGCAG